MGCRQKAPMRKNTFSFTLFNVMFTLHNSCGVKIMNDTTFISLFILFGACFGFVTYSQRHLFSEGPHKAKSSAENPFETRTFWVVLCALLWPIMVVTRIHSAWLLHKRRKQAQHVALH